MDDDRWVLFQLRMPRALPEEVERAAEREDSRSAFVRDALRRRLRELDREATRSG
jgi:metal-responsive CopG/Arc/MetJ family transcriptional regulator